ncbi:MAG: alkaline phosphatase D family protein [Luteolibacter sp.]
MASEPISRRRFVVRASSVLAVSTMLGRQQARAAEEPPESRQAMGTRVGGVTETSAIVWTRLTKNATRNNSGIPTSNGKAKTGAPLPADVSVEQLEGACPGAAGKIRVRYGTREDLSDATATDWVEVSAENDFIHHFKITGLKPGTVYHYASDTADAGGSHGSFHGRFATAPTQDTPGNFCFCVMTCQAYRDRDHHDGHNIYPAMLAMKPAFTSLTGDLVYYDTDPPAAKSMELARYHWERMFSLPRLVEFSRNAATCWLKDDHDTLKNDSWPGQHYGALTFAEGKEIFKQQAPMEDGKTYHTFRWGRDLQIWLTEGRDYRSPNTMPDGPGKTIWGAEQKEWFKKTVAESKATWKILISPTPLVGPDRVEDKSDNHSNSGFAHEGDEIREWLKANVAENFFVITGDRHWQYHSIHPKTGLHEFSVGAASDDHAGGSPGEDPAYHKFHRVKGGFLSVTLKAEGAQRGIAFELRDVNGKVVYAFDRKAEV